MTAAIEFGLVGDEIVEEDGDDSWGGFLRVQYNWGG